MDDRTIRMALERHRDAPDAGDFNVEHEINHDDAGAWLPGIGRADPLPGHPQNVRRLHWYDDGMDLLALCRQRHRRQAAAKQKCRQVIDLAALSWLRG